VPKKKRTTKDVAAATGAYSFLRSFGYVWGMTVPSIIFNNRFDQSSVWIEDMSVREALKGGRAYQLATGPYIHTLPQPVRGQVVDVYLDALKMVWFGAMAIGASGLVAVAIEKHVPLRESLETQYGLEDSGRDKGTESEEKSLEAIIGGVKQESL
jgi:hypothetical protein